MKIVQSVRRPGEFDFQYTEITTIGNLAREIRQHHFGKSGESIQVRVSSILLPGKSDSHCSDSMVECPLTSDTEMLVMIYPLSINFK